MSTSTPFPVVIDNPNTALVNIPQIEAMFRMLIDSGDMTPMARQMLRKLWDTDQPPKGRHGHQNDE